MLDLPARFEDLSVDARLGIDLFDRGLYFEAHEALETAWRAEVDPVRELYRGILQVGLAYLHIQRGNYPGAVKMFQRSYQWLDPFPAVCCGIHVGQFRRDYRVVESRLLMLGKERMDQLDRGLFLTLPRIEPER